MANSATGVPIPGHPQCPICKTEQDLVRCQGCQVVFYCGRDHRITDWPQHRSTCAPIKITRHMLTAEVEKLNHMPSMFGFTEKPFENSVGQFWGIVETRDYMRARYRHVEAILRVRNRTALQAALDHLLDMLRLNRNDNMGVRSLVPALFLRLGKDQECYDFLKWWYTRAAEPDYDWHYLNSPHRKIRDANAFEPLDDFSMQYSDLSHCAMLCLLKWRLAQDLQALDNVNVAAGEKLPIEAVDQIRSQMVSSATKNSTALMKDIESGKDISGYISGLQQQIDVLFDTVSDLNKRYWGVVVNPGGHLTARPPSYSPGTVSEMQLALPWTYDAWIETPGALDWLRARLA